MPLYGITSSLRDWAATVRKWKEFRLETGTWPVFSIVASTLHTLSLVVGGAFLIWYSGEHRWSNNHFALVLLVVLLPYMFVWAWLQNKIYLSEVRRARDHHGSNSDFGHGLDLIHHKIKAENATASEGRARGWSQLVDSSWHIDNSILIIFLVFLAATIFARALFWLFGW
jgi:hypothetical protein